MAEMHVQVVEPEQSGGHRGLQGGHGHWLAGQRRGAGQDLRQVVRVVHRGDQDGVPGQRRQAGDPGGEGALQMCGQRECLRGGLQPGVGGRADSQRQLDQGQRVAGRFAQDPLGVRVTQAGGVPGQEVARGCLVQSAQIQFGQACGGEGDVMALAHGADQHARIVAQPAGQEREHGLGRLVEPLHVVGDQEHRTLRSDVGQQVQRGERDHERLWRRPVTHAERGGKRSGLGGGQPVHGAQYWSQQIVQAGVRQVSLRLDAGGRQHLQAGRPAVVCGGP
jgi:hypothetical protein